LPAYSCQKQLSPEPGLRAQLTMHRSKTR
jgi:hypothetical protein